MTNPTQLAVLRIVVLISLAFRGSAAEAMGLGPMRLQSALGQPLRASVQVIGPEARILAENCIRGRLLAPDGTELLRPETELKRRNGQTEIAIASRAVVEEPAVTLSIEITCAPEMHRDYQLLLDLRDGLPRVLAQEVPVIRERKAPTVRTQGVGEGDTGSERRSHRRHGRISTVAAESGRSADAMESSSDSTAQPVRSRARGLPGARNVLKLSQSDLDIGKKPAAGLRLSDSISTSSSGAMAPDTEEILAAKARFLAMMRNEDPVQSAQRQIRGLQAQLQKPTATEASAGAANPAKTPATSTPPLAVVLPSTKISSAALPATSVPKSSAGRSFGGINFWLIGLGSLMLAALGVLAIIYRGSKRSAPKTASPWWMTADNTPGREAELLQAARDIAASKKAVARPTGSAELDRMLEEDRQLHRYVSQFAHSVAPTDAQTGRRLEPTGLAFLMDDATALSTTAVAGVVSAPAVDVLTPASAALPVRSIPEGLHDDLPLPRRSNVETFELVSDVMQEAEFWKMLNETKRAIDLLEIYCSSDSGLSPVPWLFLADLYMGQGDMQGYARLQKSFRTRFNGRMSEALDEVGTGGIEDGIVDTRRSLEDYPHVMQKISSLWGQYAVVPFLQDLLINQRDTPRQGFNLPVYREILLLIDVARAREQEFA